jgi:hypothetical protein
LPSVGNIAGAVRLEALRVSGVRHYWIGQALIRRSLNHVSKPFARVHRRHLDRILVIARRADKTRLSRFVEKLVYNKVDDGSQYLLCTSMKLVLSSNQKRCVHHTT